MFQEHELSSGLHVSHHIHSGAGEEKASRGKNIILIEEFIYFYIYASSENNVSVSVFRSLRNDAVTGSITA